MSKSKVRKIFISFNNAIEGIIYVLKTQRSMRIHFIAAVIVLIAGFLLNVTKSELILLGFAITLVLAIEMINTAAELVVNIIKDSYHPVVRIIKDILAGAVLIASVNAIVTGYLIFYSKIDISLVSGLTIIKQAPPHIAFIILFLVVFVVLAIKTYFRKGTPMEGGMPSGHTAVAFAIWSVIVFIAMDFFISFLTFLLALLVGQTRLKTGIHNIWEVIVGALIGILITTAISQIFW
ncbi:MAG: diacylglycerol kinase [Candidatus Firestonebacteria bacterium]